MVPDEPTQPVLNAQQQADADAVLDITTRPADPDVPEGEQKYPNEPEPVIEPTIAENSVPTSPSFVYSPQEGEDRSLEKPETIRSPTQAEQRVFGAPGITVSGEHQKDGKDYVQAGGNPGQIGHGMVLGKAGENDLTAPRSPSDLPPQTENPASTADASELPE